MTAPGSLLKSAAARCEPVPAFPLLPRPSSCPAWPSADPSLPGVSRFRHFRSYLNCLPTRHGPLRHPPPPGVSRFRHFRCYLNRQPAPHGPLRHPSLPGVSRFRRIGSHLRRVTQAPGPVLWHGRPGTGSLLLNTKASQEAARSRCAAQQNISGVPYR